MNRILSFLLALVFAFSLGTEVLAATESGGRENEETDCLDSFSFNLSYNEDVSAGIAGESKMQTLMLTDMRRPMNMTLNFESIDGDYYRAYGTISLPNGNKSYSAEGNVNQYVLKSGLSGYIGNLIGVVGGATNINLTIHTIPTKNLMFAYVTIGELSDHSNISTFTYGEMFDEMNELVGAYVESKNDVATSETIDSQTYNRRVNGVMKSADDYNITYRDCRYGVRIASGRGNMTGGRPQRLAPYIF